MLGHYAFSDYTPNRGGARNDSILNQWLRVFKRALRLTNANRLESFDPVATTGNILLAMTASRRLCRLIAGDPVATRTAAVLVAIPGVEAAALA